MEECGFSRIGCDLSSIALFLNFIVIHTCIRLKRNFYFFRVTWRNSYSSVRFIRIIEKFVSYSPRIIANFINP